MDKLDVTGLERCLSTLKRAHGRLVVTGPEQEDHDLFRAACVKEFELILEIVTKLLRRVLREYVVSPRELSEMNYKDIFRRAARHSLLTLEEVDQWFLYRDNRNATAHEYGQNFAAKVVAVLPEFIRDSEAALAMFRAQAHA